MGNRCGCTIAFVFCVLFRVLLSVLLYALLAEKLILRGSWIKDDLNFGVVVALLVVYFYFLLLIAELSPTNAFRASLLAEFVAVQDLHDVIQPYVEASPTVTFSCCRVNEGSRRDEVGRVDNNLHAVTASYLRPCSTMPIDSICQLVALEGFLARKR